MKNVRKQSYTANVNVEYSIHYKTDDINNSSKQWYSIVEHINPELRFIVRAHKTLPYII